MRIFKAILLAPLPVFLALGGWFLFESLAAMHSHELLAQTFRTQAVMFSLGYFFIAYLFILLGALPIFLILRIFKLANLYSAIIVGFFLGGLFILGPEISCVLTIGPNHTLSSRVAECQMIVENVRTACGYAELFRTSFFYGVIGAIIGATFWGVYALGDRVRFTFVATLFGAIALGIFAISYATRDTSCHNLALYKKASIPAWLGGRLQVPIAEKRNIIDIMREHAVANDLSFQDYTLPRSRIELSTCNDAGYFVSIGELAVFERKQIDTNEDEAVFFIHFSEVVDGERDLLLARDLITRIKNRWPGAFVYTDSRGRIVATESEAIVSENY